MAYWGNQFVFWRPRFPMLGILPFGVWIPYRGGGGGGGRRRGGGGGGGRRRGGGGGRRRGGGGGGGRGRAHYYHEDGYEGDAFEDFEYAGEEFQDAIEPSTRVDSWETFSDGDFDISPQDIGSEEPEFSDEDVYDEYDYEDAGEDYQEHEYNDEEEDSIGFEGFQRITPDEYFSGVLEAIPKMDLDTVKHIRIMAINSQKLASERGESEIARGFDDIVCDTERVLEEEYDVTNVGVLEKHELASETGLLPEDVADAESMEKYGLESFPLLDILSSEHDPLEVMKIFKIQGHGWKKFLLPRFSKTSRIPKDEDYRRVIRGHIRLTFYYVIARHMTNFAKSNRIKVSGGPTGNDDVSSQYVKYFDLLAAGVQLTLRNQLRYWKFGIKIMVRRGLGIMYGPDYGRTRGSVQQTREILNKFETEFETIMLKHIKLEKDVIDYISKRALVGRGDQAMIQKKKDAILKHGTEYITPFFAKIIVFSFGQSKDITQSDTGKMIGKVFSDAWSANVESIVILVQTLAKTGFQLDPMELRKRAKLPFEKGKSVGIMLNSYVYGNGGEPMPVKVVRRLNVIFEL